MKTRPHAILTALFTLLPLLGSAIAKPNVVILYADDMGYGDVQCLNPKLWKGTQRN